MSELSPPNRAGYDTEPTVPEDFACDALSSEQEQPEVSEIISKNFERIKNRRGEDFAKEIRGVLTEYLSIPGFDEKICEIIPNKYAALETLQDNNDYIRAELEDHYSSEASVEQEVKNPYELAKKVGFELTKPINTVEQIENFKDDFRRGEHLCTFNDIESRMREYHILWLRHEGADGIMPADELTEQNLTEEWMQYLKEANRYNEATGEYDLTNLRPAREDPYGTSSMSVQISKTGTHVSIKNRYNHTVPSPDATLDNNLDNLTAGLKKAVYTEVGREDLLRSTSIPLAGGYITDNKNGIHPYNYEKDNVYYGNYEIISNGQVESIPQDQYYMLTPELYVKRGEKGGGIIAFDKNDNIYEDAYHYINEDGVHIVSFVDDGKEKYRYEYQVDEKGKMADKQLRVYDPGNMDFRDDPERTKLIFEQNIGGSLDLSRLTSAEGLTLPQSVGGYLYLSNLTSAEGLTLPQSVRGDLSLRRLISAEGLTLPESVGRGLNLSRLISAEGLTLPESVGGDLDLSSLTSAEGLTLPESFGGDLYLSNLTSAEGLTLPQSVRGDLDLSSLISAEGLTLPESVGGYLNLRSLTSAEGLTLPESVGGDLDLYSLISAEGLTLPESIGGYLNLRSLTSAEGLTLPESIEGNLNLSSLTSAKGLILPESVGGGLDLRRLTSAEGLTLPESVRGGLDLSDLTSAEGLTLPQSVGGYLCLRSLTSAEGLTLPESVGGVLNLSRLISSEGLTLPQSVRGDLDLSRLTSAEGLTLPESVGGDLDLSRLTSAEGLTLPESVGGDLYLSSLTSAKGLILPESIEGNLNLSSLTSAEGLTLPESIGGNLYLSNLTSAEGLTLPESIGGDLDLSSLTSTEGLTLPQRVVGRVYLNTE